MKHLLWMIGLSSLLMTSACTQSSSTSHIHISLPADASSENSVSEKFVVGAKPMDSPTPTPTATPYPLAASTTAISAIIVQITGPDMATPIRATWTRVSDSDVPQTDFDIDVPIGIARVFQVALIKDVGNSVGAYYGAAQQPVSGDTTDVSLSLTLQNNPALGQTKLAGHYATALGTAPSGHVVYMYNPSDGLPALPVHLDEIYNGWMELTLFDDLNLSFYILETGEKLFPGSSPLNSSSLDFYSTANTANATKIYVPAGYRNAYGNVAQAIPAHKEIIGFFGGPLATLIGTQTLMSSITQTLTNYFSDAQLSLSSSWQPTAGVSDTNHAHPLNTLSGANGGTTITAPCSNSSRFVTCIDANVVQMGQNSQGIANFIGPFVSASASSSVYIDTSASSWASGGSTLSATWAYLPNMSSVVKSVGVFYKALPAGWSGSDFDSEDGLDCNNMGDHGFTFAGAVDINATPSISIPGLSNVSGTPYALALCPYSNTLSLYLTKGVWTYWTVPSH